MAGTEARNARAALEALDLFGADFVADPFPVLDQLRRHAPVHRDAETGLWLVSRYADVREILMDPHTYLPDNAQNAVSRLSVPALRILAASGFALPPALANNGGPTHAGLRSLVAGFLTSTQVSAAVPVIESTASRLLETVAEELRSRAESDLSTAYARPLPCLVMMRLLGVTGVPLQTLLTWSEAALELFYGKPTPQRQLLLAEHTAAFFRWLTELTAAQDSEGLPAALQAHFLPSGAALSPATAVAVCFFVFIAAQATTGQLISTVLSTAAADPQVWSNAGHEEGFAEAWVDETLRREPPVTTWRRVARRDVLLSDVPVPTGAELLLMLMSTGSDPAVFIEPQRLCPQRPNARLHLSFGAGPHRCPGAALARTEAAAALRIAARELGEVQLLNHGPYEMTRLLSFRAPARVPIGRPS